MFSKRIIKPELLDHLPPQFARRNLADLVRINETFGGHSVIRRALARVADPNDEFTLLDLGAASGDTARLVHELYPRASVTSLDKNFVNLEAAPAPKLLADAFHLPFRAETFDYVICSLFLHHFENREVVALLGSFYRIARRALLVCDLERHVLPYSFLAATRWLFGWDRVTVHDGMISVRAGFRPRELEQLSKTAGIEKAEAVAYRPAFRIALVARKAAAVQRP